MNLGLRSSSLRFGLRAPDDMRDHYHELFQFQLLPKCHKDGTISARFHSLEPKRWHLDQSGASEVLFIVVLDSETMYS